MFRTVSVQCERGSPLRIGEESQRCQANNQCPMSHECRVDQGVCCPRKQTICAQPLRVGDCTENVKRYWYNAKARQCQMFEYTGKQEFYYLFVQLKILKGFSPCFMAERIQKMYWY
ncbi:Kunitz/Bovine pancreatic trypsin inhibitor domain protein [Cooperia oncophora]